MKEASTQQSKATQPKAVTFPKKNELPQVGLEPTTLHTLDRALYQLRYRGTSAGWAQIFMYMYMKLEVGNSLWVTPFWLNPCMINAFMTLPSLTLYCVALPCCLFDLASFFLPSHLSLKHVHVYTCTCMHTCMSAHSDVQASYTITLRDLSERVSCVKDIQFLNGYNNPTLFILYEPTPTWAG